MKRLALSLAVIGLLFSHLTLLAQRQTTIPYQGTIADLNGTPFNGSFAFTFELKNTSGTSLWTSGTITLPVNLGAYSVELGAGTQPTVNPLVWKQNDSIQLHISFDDGVNGMETLTPAINMLPVPYAVRSYYADSLCTDTISVAFARADTLYSFVSRSDTIYAVWGLVDTIRAGSAIVAGDLDACGDIILKGVIRDPLDNHRVGITGGGIEIDGPDGDPATKQTLNELEQQMEDALKALRQGLTADGGEIKVTDKGSGNEVKVELDALDSIVRMLTGRVIILPDPGSPEKVEIDEEAVRIEDALRAFEQAINGTGGEIKATDKTSGNEVKVELDAVDSLVRMLTGELIILPDPGSQGTTTIDEESVRIEDALRSLEQAINGTGGEIKATDKTSGNEVKVELDALDSLIRAIATGGIVVLPNPFSDEKSTVDEEALRIEDALRDFAVKLEATGGTIEATDKNTNGTTSFKMNPTTGQICVDGELKVEDPNDPTKKTFINNEGISVETPQGAAGIGLDGGGKPVVEITDDQLRTASITQDTSGRLSVDEMGVVNDMEICGDLTVKGNIIGNIASTPTTPIILTSTSNPGFTNTLDEEGMTLEEGTNSGSIKVDSAGIKIDSGGVKGNWEVCGDLKVKGDITNPTGGPVTFDGPINMEDPSNPGIASLMDPRGFGVSDDNTGQNISVTRDIATGDPEINFTDANGVRVTIAQDSSGIKIDSGGVKGNWEVCGDLEVKGNITNPTGGPVTFDGPINMEDPSNPGIASLMDPRGFGVSDDNTGQNISVTRDIATGDPEINFTDANGVRVTIAQDSSGIKIDSGGVKGNWEVCGDLKLKGDITGGPFSRVKVPVSLDDPSNVGHNSTHFSNGVRSSTPSSTIFTGINTLTGNPLIDLQSGAHSGSITVDSSGIKIDSGGVTGDWEVCGDLRVKGNIIGNIASTPTSPIILTDAGNPNFTHTLDEEGLTIENGSNSGNITADAKGIKIDSGSVTGNFEVCGDLTVKGTIKNTAGNATMTMVDAQQEALLEAQNGLRVQSASGSDTQSTVKGDEVKVEDTNAGSSGSLNMNRLFWDDGLTRTALSNNSGVGTGLRATDVGSSDNTGFTINPTTDQIISDGSLVIELDTPGVKTTVRDRSYEVTFPPTFLRAQSGFIGTNPSAWSFITTNTNTNNFVAVTCNPTTSQFVFTTNELRLTSPTLTAGHLYRVTLSNNLFQTFYEAPGFTPITTTHNVSTGTVTSNASEWRFITTPTLMRTTLRLTSGTSTATTTDDNTGNSMSVTTEPNNRRFIQSSGTLTVISSSTFSANDVENKVEDTNTGNSVSFKTNPNSGQVCVDAEMKLENASDPDKKSFVNNEGVSVENDTSSVDITTNSGTGRGEITFSNGANSITVTQTSAGGLDVCGDLNVKGRLTNSPISPFFIDMGNSTFQFGNSSNSQSTFMTGQSIFWGAPGTGIGSSLTHNPTTGSSTLFSSSSPTFTTSLIMVPSSRLIRMSTSSIQMTSSTLQMTRDVVFTSGTSTVTTTDDNTGKSVSVTTEPNTGTDGSIKMSTSQMIIVPSTLTVQRSVFVTSTDVEEKTEDTNTGNSVSFKTNPNTGQTCFDGELKIESSADPTKKTFINNEGISVETSNGSVELTSNGSGDPQVEFTDASLNSVTMVQAGGSVNIGATDGSNTSILTVDGTNRAIGANADRIAMSNPMTALDLVVDPAQQGLVSLTATDLIGRTGIVFEFDAGNGSITRTGVSDDATTDGTGMTSAHLYDAGNRVVNHLVIDDNTANQVGMAFLPNTQTIDAFGNVNIQGNLTKLSGNFRIDHPLDPENKYLYHSFVESNEMMNIYNGNITTDDLGVATVEMPDYFEALNMDFRYQLTVVGEFAQAIVGEEISDNTFVIKTDKPNVKVSWQVTGVRQDAYAIDNRMQVEVEKEPEMKGQLLYTPAQ